MQSLPHLALCTVPKYRSRWHFHAHVRGLRSKLFRAGSRTPGRQCHPPPVLPHWRGRGQDAGGMGAPSARTAGSRLPDGPVLFALPASLQPLPSVPNDVRPHDSCAPQFLPVPPPPSRGPSSAVCHIPACSHLRKSGFVSAVGLVGCWCLFAPLFGRTAAGKAQRARGGS